MLEGNQPRADPEEVVHTRGAGMDSRLGGKWVKGKH